MHLKSDYKRQKSSTQQNGNQYIEQIYYLFMKVKKCRAGISNNHQEVVDEIKALERPGNMPFGPVMQYILSNLQMTSAVLGDIRYLRAIDSTLFKEVLDYIAVLADHVYKSGNVVCYNLLVDDCKYTSNPIDELSLVTLYNNYELVNYFVTQKGYDVNAVQSVVETPLITAVDKGYAAITRVLLANGANIEARRGLNSVFGIAIEKGHLLVLTELVDFQNRSDKSVTSILDDDGYTLLHKAIYCKQKQIVDYLFRYFTKDLKDPNGFDLVAYACTENLYEMAEYLVNTYPDNFSYTTPCVDDSTILHFCSHTLGTFRVAKSLIDGKKVSISKQNNAGNTFLHVAVREDNIILIKYYLYLYKQNQVQPIVNLENIDGKTVGHLLLEAKQTDILLEYINDTDLNLLQKNKSGETLLEAIIASSDRDLTFAALLRIQGTNKNKRKQARGLLYKPEILKNSIDLLMLIGVTNSHEVPEHEQRITEWVYAEQTPLHIICEELAFADIQAMITKHGFDVNVKNAKKCAVLQHMLINGRVTEAKQFIEAYQPNLLDLDNMSSSLLHLACDLQSLDLVEYCLSKGLSPLLYRHNTVSVLYIAINLENPQIVRALWTKLSVAEQFEYFKQANEQERKFLQKNKIYTISIEQIIQQLRESVLDLLLPEIAKPLAAEAFEDLHTEQLKIQTGWLFGKALDVVGDNFADALIIDVAKVMADEKIESELQDDLKLKLDEMLIAVDERSQAEYLANQELVIKEEYAVEKMLHEVKERNYNYFRDLPIWHPDLQELLSQNAVPLILQAIATRDQQLTILLLSIPMLEAQAHAQDNILYNTACEYRQSLVVKRLMEIAAVQKARIPKTGSTQQTHDLVPNCKYNPNYGLVFIELAKLLKTDKYKDLELFACGSGAIKYSPHDLDIISPGSEHTFTKHLVFSLLDDLAKLGAKVSKDADDNLYGHLSPKSKPDRRIIAVEWWGCKFEIILTSQTLAHHAYNSYAKVTALYFCLRESEMLEIDGVGSLADYHSYTIDSVVEPMLSFTVDFNRIFKLIVLSVTSPANFHLVNGNIQSFNYDLSSRVIKSIFELFSTSMNPFMSYNVKIAKLRPRLAAIFSYDNPMPIVRALHDLKVLPHLLDYLHTQKGEHARAYRESLIGLSERMDKQIVTSLQQQITQIYSPPLVVSPSNYDPRVFRVSPQEAQLSSGQSSSSIVLPNGQNY